MFAKLYEHEPDPVRVFDDAGRVIYENAAGRLLCGEPPGLADMVQRAVRTGTSSNGPMLHCTGETVTAVLTVHTDESGVLLGVAARLRPDGSMTGFSHSECPNMLIDAIDRLDQGFALYDRDDRLVLCNRRYRESFPKISDLLVPGAAYPDLLRAGIEKGQFDVPAETAEAWVQDRLAQRREGNGPAITPLEDGSWVVSEERRTHNGGMVVIRTDITSLKNSERALRRQTRLINTVLQSISQGVLAFDAFYNLTAANDRFFALTGIDRALGEPGTPLTSILLDAARNQEYGEGEPMALAQEHLRQLMRHEHITFEHVRPNGQTLEFTRTPVLGGGLVITVADVTTRKLNDRRLRENEHELRTLVDGVLDGILSAAPDGRIKTFNPAAQRIFGYSAREVLNRDISILMQTPTEGLAAVTEAAACGGDPNCAGIARELTGKRKDGSTFPMDFSIAEVGREDARRFIAIARDITERKRLEELKNEFVSTVSHELRTPLTAIHGALSFLNSAHVGDLPEKARQLAQVAARNSERLIRLVNDILDVEKMDSGRMTFTFEPVDPRRAAEQAIESISGFAERYDVRIVLEADPTPPVRADRDRLEQVLINLLSNAVKFSPQGDPVTVSVQENRDMVRFTVADNGPGIPASQRLRVFEKFAQLEGSDGRQRAGTGLGLAIVQRIVERHGGSIDFVSLPELGTRFFVDLPLVHQFAELSTSAPLIDA